MDIKTRIANIDELVPEPNNARTRDGSAKAELKASLEKFGAARSLVIDGKGVVRAGSGTLEAAKAAGVREVIIVETDGKKLVVVKRPDWSDQEAEVYGLSDNKTGELSRWDDAVLFEKLHRIATAGVDAVPGFTVPELEEILGTAAMAVKHVEFDAQLAALDGSEEVALRLLIPKKHEAAVTEWLQNGEPASTAGCLGRGVLKRCGLA
jgi:hypothetical protein